MRRTGNLIEKIADTDNLYLAFYKAIRGKGIPIGNLTSQYFANFYLSEFDHFAKESLKIPVYIRYMDDILIFENDKKYGFR
ncbi:MAG: RNA-directed DNA polymerase [Prevotellaceae bacterium]|jgi:hypothetical protein|nr:RNA-directed DNA polymerase [Prevotellaceae bacterium]